MNCSKSFIEVKDVSFSYNNKVVLKDVSFSLERGDFLSIIGANGVGKSTLIKIMLNILKQTSGTINFETKGAAAYVSQKASSFNQGFPATASEIVSLGLYKKRGNTKKAVEDALVKVNMLEHKNSIVGQLSGGQQQRIFIAKALASEPQILFLDEPTVGIDSDSVGNICCLLGELNKNFALTILMITHDMSSIINHSNKILFFEQDGRVCLYDAQKYAELFLHKR